MIVQIPPELSGMDLRIDQAGGLVQLRPDLAYREAPVPWAVYAQTVPCSPIFVPGPQLRQSGWMDSRKLRLPTAKDMPTLERAARILEYEALYFKALEMQEARR